MSRKQAIIKGTFILTATGFLSRLIGFFYRIFLSQHFGEEGVGLYQLIFPIYALCFSFAVAGIEVALSRNTARKISQGKFAEARQLLKGALLLSASLSVLVTLVLQFNADFIARVILGDLRCRPLIIAMSYSFPFAAVHCCICGYYLGFKKTGVTAVSQLIEQSARVLFVYLVILSAVKQSLNLDVTIAVLGLVFGEICSSTFCILAFHQSDGITIRKKKRTSPYHHLMSMKELLPMAIPLTGNRVLLNILQSIEAVSIPRFLQLYGLSTTEALSVYGVLMGMALPCILFPSAITSSISTMLLPTIAEMQTGESKRKLNSLIKKISGLCFLLGILCLAFFLIFGRTIGDLVFHSENAGSFIITLAWICPFLFTNTTFTSILNGLGKANTTFTINAIGLSLRVASVFFLIPMVGIIGYLWGLLISQVITTMLSLYHLRRYLL